MPKYSAHLLELARKGAEARLKEIEAEMLELRKVFGRLPFGSAVSPAISARESEVIPTPRRSRLSAAQRKAVSQRMKKYWAVRRAAKKR